MSPKDAGVSTVGSNTSLLAKHVVFRKNKNIYTYIHILQLH